MERSPGNLVPMRPFVYHIHASSPPRLVLPHRRNGELENRAMCKRVADLELKRPA